MATTTVGYFVSIPVSYFKDEDSINGMYLGIALLLIVSGFLVTLFSQYLNELKQSKYSRVLPATINTRELEEIPVQEFECNNDKLTVPEEEAKSLEVVTANPEKSLFWVLMCAVGSLLGTGWSQLPLIVYTARVAPITEPSIIFILLIGGYATMMGVLVIAGRGLLKDIILHDGELPMQSLAEFMAHLSQLPQKQKLSAVFVGICSATGYMCYYTVVIQGPIPTAICLAFLLVKTPLGILASFITGDERESVSSRILVGFGFIFYVAATVLLFSSSYQ